MRLVRWYSMFVCVSPGQAWLKSIVKSLRKNEADNYKKNRKIQCQGGQEIVSSFVNIRPHSTYLPNK